VSGPLWTGNVPRYRRGTNDPHGYIDLATRVLWTAVVVFAVGIVFMLGYIVGAVR